ncbi:MAG: glucose-6-phosphate dehydrogenase [Pseudomonadota bacterium]
MSSLNPVEPFDLIIFGGTGDLAMRKLLPAIYRRDEAGQLPDPSRIIGIARAPMEVSEFQQRLYSALNKYLGADPDETVWRRFSSRLSYLDLDVTDKTAQNWRGLHTLLEADANPVRAAYLSVSPRIYGAIASGLSANNLVTDDMRLVLEKPIGIDQDSANAINEAVGRYFNENQIFRIDHYLGKETVQNLLALRFGNAIFEPLWRREVIDHVQITVAEELGVGNRVEFYEHIGALKDMVQNHLLQLVCLVAMEPPVSLDVDAVRSEKIKVLKALKPISGADVLTQTVRGQYRAGAVDGVAVDGYEDELTEASNTETYVALKLEIENWRWSGTPFYLRTGKRLPEKRSEIVIRFKPVPHSIFSGLQPNGLRISLQPDEGVKLTTMVKEPGPGGFELEAKDLDLSFAEAFGGATYPDAYERLIIEVLRGNPTLFMHRDEVAWAWRFIDNITEGWQNEGQKVEKYFAGSWGPHGASNLLDRDGRAWQADL